MSGGTGLDVRLPIGGLFSVLGAMLAAYGLVAGSGTASFAAGTTSNVDLWWGLVMLVFGVLLLVGSHRARRRLATHPAPEGLEGQATEDRERRLGLEH